MTGQRTLDNTNLSAIEREALADLRARLSNELAYVEDVILFGSAARGTADAESDIDLLVLTAYALPYQQRHQITAVLTDINDLYETNFSSLVVDRAEWEEGVMTVPPDQAGNRAEWSAGMTDEQRRVVVVTLYCNTH